MGTVTCCKRPNELIEDKDLLKKTTLKRNILLKKDLSQSSGQESPFITLNEKESHSIDTKTNIYTDMNTNININSRKNKYTNNVEDEDNKLIDLEKKEENIENQPTIGPSDNHRKKRSKNMNVQSQSPEEPNYYTYNSNFKTRNEYEQTQTQTQLQTNTVDIAEKKILKEQEGN
jgi:hypothetical protein